MVYPSGTSEAQALSPPSGRCVVVRRCDGVSDALSLVDFDRRMSVELLGQEDEERLSETFLQQVRRRLCRLLKLPRLPLSPLPIVILHRLQTLEQRISSAGTLQLRSCSAPPPLVLRSSAPASGST
jgi:hypothetical protein